MSAGTMIALVARCRALCRPRSGASDAELVMRFAQQRDAAAFEELLERYAPLVWGVCRRILPCEVDCEDAFQATFLALVRKPDSIDPRQSLGAWLHTVAVRVARKALARSHRRYPPDFPARHATAGDVADEVESRELLRLVDEEIERLPATLREPLVLCCLQGRTRDEAAEALGCSVMVIKGRLERGRDLLRRRLERRGVELPAAFLVLSLTGERIRAALWAKTMQTAMYTPSHAVATLAEAGSSAVTVKCRLLTVALLLVTSAAGAAGSLVALKTEEPARAIETKEPAEVKPKKPEVPQVRRDRHGDPLPASAIARLGTVRWRHGFYISSLAYSPDGKKIAASGGGRAVTLWDVATGKEIHQFPNRNQPNGVAFSPDGKVLAAPDTLVCRQWDVATGKEIRQLKGHTNGLHSVAFAPDGKTLATSSYDGTARIWETATGKELRCLDCKQGHLYSVAYSPDGRVLATGGADGSIRLWDGATGTVQHKLEGHKELVWALVFSPDGKHLASSSEDATIRLWDPATGRQTRRFDEKAELTRSPIAFSPDGALLAFGTGGGLIRLWEMATGKEKRHWRASERAIRAIAFAPDGNTLASEAIWNGTIRLWDVATGREKNPSDEHRGLIASLRFSPDAKRLISIGSDQRLLEWELDTNTPRQKSSWSAKRYIGVALSPDGDTLAVDGWPDSHVRLWNIRTSKPRCALGKPQDNPLFTAIAFSPDNRLVAAQGDDHVIHLWDARGGNEIRQLKGSGEKVLGLTFSPDGKLLAGGTREQGAKEGAVHLWDVTSGKEIQSFKGIGPIPAIGFSPSGNVLAAGEGDSTAGFVRLWDTATGKELCRHSGHRESIGAVVFSPDGRLIASGTGFLGWTDNSVHVWEAATGQLIKRFEGQHSCIHSVAFSPDGLMVASGAGDSTILLWDITGRRSDGRWHAKPPTPRELEICWAALKNEDAAKAYNAVWALVAAPEQSVPFLHKHLPPISRPDAKAIARWIADLDNDDFAMRQKASEELSKLGDAITTDLRATLQGKPSLEKRRRVHQLLDRTSDWTSERLRYHRSIQALEHIGTRRAREVLQALAAGAPDARCTEEAKAALQRMARSSSPAKNP